MGDVMVLGITTIIVLLGVVFYIGLAGVAIIYSLGANGSPKGRRIFFGILGVAMVCAFAYMCIQFHK